MKTFFRVFTYARKLGIYVPQYILYTLMSVLFSAFNFALLIPLLNVLFDQVDASTIEKPGDFAFSIDYLKVSFNYFFTGVIEESGKAEALLFVCMAVVISVLMTNLFRYAAAVINSKIRLDVVKFMRMDIYSRVAGMHLGFFTNERKGDLISKITNDVQEVEVSILNSPKTLFREPLAIIIFFIFLFTLSFKLTLMAIIIIPVAGGAVGTLVRRLKRKAVQSQESLGRIVNILDETLGGMRIIKAFNARDYVTKKIDDETNYYRKVNLGYSYRRELGSPMSEILGATILCGVLYFGGSLVLQDQSSLDASEFITYLAVFSQIITPSKTFSNGISAVQKGIASAERIFSVVDTKPAIEDAPDAVELKKFESDITFKNVSFSYDQTPVLNDISFTINKGKTVALVGASGGGKSTLVDLIPRFYDPVSGEVQIDGKSLKTYKTDSIRKHMGIVTQESILFNDTVFNNIAFGIDNPSPEKVREAAKIANAHDFIQELENGYETNIGDRGNKLSGGQRQRVSIARAVMKNPDILILDEATSALDSESERLVQDALSKLMHNRTSVVIAHRLSTIQHADLILVIEAGRIIEQGTHDELVQQGGIYKKLSSMQNT